MHLVLVNHLGGLSLPRNRVVRSTDVHLVLVNHLGGLSLPRNRVVRSTDCPNMTIAVYHGHKVTTQQQQKRNNLTLLINI